MLENFLSSYRDFAPLALRLTLGVILIRHGWPKLVVLAELTGESEDDIRSNWAKDKSWTPSMDSAERERLYAGWQKAVTRTLDWVDAD